MKSKFRISFGPPKAAETDDVDLFSKLVTASDEYANVQRVSVEEAHEWAMERGARCTECPLYQKRLGPVKSTIRKPGHARLTIIGEAPGKTEVEEKENFTGKSGDELNAALHNGGLDRSHVNILNVMACRPDIEGGSINDYLQRLDVENGKRISRGEQPLISPIEACRPRFKAELTACNTQVDLAVGGKALEALCEVHKLNYGKGEDYVGSITVATIKNQHGAPIILDGGKKIICSSLHPAFAMRGARAYKHVIRNDITRAVKIAVRGYVEWRMPDNYKNGIWPSFDRIINTLLVWRELGVEIALDIETDSADTQTCRVRCIGVGTVLDGVEHVLVIPIRYMNGSHYWTSDDSTEHVAIRKALIDLLDNNEITAHNGMFDTQVMLRLGYMTNRSKLWTDTMLLDHDTDANDLPHDLGAVTRRYLEAPLWKKMVDHKDAGSVSRDDDLHEYNAIDVVTTMRITPFLRERVAQNGTQLQYETDRALGPIARDMEVLGVFIDEAERGRLSEKLNRLCFALRDKFWKFAGKPINPRSTQQLQKWLFEEEGLEPPLNPQGYEWKEGDGMSTGAAAITTLLNQGLRKELASALQTLLEYKKAEKLRNTYVDNIRVRYAEDFADLPRMDPVILDVINEAGDVERVETLPERPALSRIHPTWKIHVVPTGRWASSPNVQNWPSNAWGGLNLKTQVVAPPGHVIVGADFEQIELRIYAVQANDQLLLKAFFEGIDPHCMNAATLLCDKDDDGAIMDLTREYIRMKKEGTETEQKLVKHYRTIAKRFVYLETYGGEEGKLFSTMAFERDKVTGKLVFPDLKASDVEKWHERWHSRHPETRRWQDSCASFQRRHGYVQALGDNRRRFFPGGPDRKNQVANHTIQGSAAFIANRGVRELARAIPHFAWSPYSGLCLQVHDYIGAYVPETYAEQTIGLVNECLYTEITGMPFPVDTPKATKRWSEQD